MFYVYIFVKWNLFIYKIYFIFMFLKIHLIKFKDKQQRKELINS